MPERWHLRNIIMPVARPSCDLFSYVKSVVVCDWYVMCGCVCLLQPIIYRKLLRHFLRFHNISCLLDRLCVPRLFSKNNIIDQFLLYIYIYTWDMLVIYTFSQCLCSRCLYVLSCVCWIYLMLPIKKTFIDSRHCAVDSTCSSDVQICLPINITLPPTTPFFSKTYHHPLRLVQCRSWKQC